MSDPRTEQLGPAEKLAHLTQVQQIANNLDPGTASLSQRRWLSENGLGDIAPHDRATLADLLRQALGQTASGAGETSTRPHDLPPLWDGHPVEWNPWNPGPFFICDMNDRPFCDKCGSDRSPAIASGVRKITEGSRTRGKVLSVSRCLDCGHDTVWDPWTKTWWDLDDSDYEDTGSYAQEDQNDD